MPAISDLCTLQLILSINFFLITFSLGPFSRRAFETVTQQQVFLVGHGETHDYAV